MKLSLRSLSLIGLLGGLGGAINAWGCYARFPVPVVQYKDFTWHVIPVGAYHGFVLAVVTIGCAAFFLERGWVGRFVGLILTGWLCGWLSWIPIAIYFEGGTSRAILWPFHWTPRALWEPYCYFGFVGLIYYFLLNIYRHLAEERLEMHLSMAIVSGSLGSLWWWISWEPWYLSILHGTIWGMLVGFGVWKYR